MTIYNFWESVFLEHNLLRVRGGRQEARRGSVLLVTLLSVSLLLVVVLMLVTVVRMELRSVSAKQTTLLARANARLGLQLAVALLQEQAGPDQRVTARGEIMGGQSPDGGSLWTGVWKRDASGGLSGNPVWLVSGHSANQNVSSSSPQITLHSETMDHPGVSVPKMKNTSQGIAYAFWISDEGVKASVAARRHAVEMFDLPGLEPLRTLAEYQVDFGVNPIDLVPDTFDLLMDIDLAGSFDKVGSLGNLALLPGTPTTETLREFSHDFTALALGVLENAYDGGLKINLSDPEYRDHFLANEELQKYLEPKNGFLTADFSLPADRGVAPGMPFFAPRPLVTEAVFHMGILHDQVTERLHLRYHLEAELLNPYSLPLVFEPDPNPSRSRGLGISLRNLPQITVEDMTTQSAVPSISHQPGPLTSWMNILPHPSVPNRPLLLPGEVYLAFEPDSQAQGAGYQQNFGSVSWSTGPDDDANIRISAPAQAVEMGLFPFDFPSGSIPPDQPSVQDMNLAAQRFENIPFQGFQFSRVFNQGSNRFSFPDSADYVLTDKMFSYHFRLSSDSANTAAMRDILTAVDIRDPVFNVSDTYEDIEGDSQSKLQILDLQQVDPSLATDFFSANDLFDAGPAQTRSSSMLLYDIPDGKVFSVGQLSSLHIYQRAPRSIGNPWGADLNRAFDKYYFSPRLQVNGSEVPIHPAIRQHTPENPGAPLQNSAAHELVVGQFNINSTSVKAWESVLSAQVFTPGAVANLDEPFAAFFRLPIYQSGGAQFYVDVAEIENPLNAFSQGGRALYLSENQIRNVAQRIVEGIRSRAQPFADLAEFVNSGILQEAIDGTVPPVNDGLIEFSNVYLQQSDVMLRLAPVASTRSDTFKIRTYGSVIGPNDEVLSVAYGEAVVQRLPDKVNSENAMTASDDLQNMRRFKVHSFKWLSDEEI